MKKSILGPILLVVLTQVSWAKIKTRILHIDAPDSITDSYEVLVAKNSTPYTVSAQNIELVDRLIEAEKYNSVIEIETVKTEIVSLHLIEAGDDIIDFYDYEGELHPMTGYTPSNVSSYDEAARMFKYLKGRTKWFTQCFNRAHIWAKQMYDRDRVYSMKIFIFYTKKFRRTIDDKWWFHVAPMLDVNGDYYVMDQEFTKAPKLEHEWEHIFTRKMEEKGIEGYRCKVIRNIREYYEPSNQKDEYCNILIASMYYRMPLNMSNLEKTGEQQTQWKNGDLRASAREIYWRWRRVYEEVRVR